ncbi:GGDEF domain-containing protein [Gemmatimonas sp.]|uniref:GGDEF domain-containing protein n=1 Tax=Gemmatimonas sp. TaxID=1962908 RepID=UPI00286B9476|nr:GGDEF domain-containing protein [Gemmatimonas sp.]
MRQRKPGALSGSEYSAPRYFVAVQRDITAFRRRLADAEEGARTDALTGLANRRAYDARLAAMLTQPDLVLGLLAMDIDRFKQVNDSYGHGTGDAVLIEVSRRMSSVAAMTPGALNVTISIGVASATSPMATADLLSRAADRALYRAKTGGRNRVEVAVGDGEAA